MNSSNTDTIDFKFLNLEPDSIEYKSKLRNWYEEAGVRKFERRLINTEEIKGKLFFTPELVPISLHPKILSEDSIRREVLLYHLLTYINFTNVLEHEMVNTVTKKIAQERTFYRVPQEMKLDAYKIYCDEAYHALFSEDVYQQLEQLSEYDFNFNGRRFRPSFEQKYYDIVMNLHGKDLQLAETLFVIVSETLITKTLVKVPKDNRVLTIVRDMMNDHAQDEAKHHDFFSQLLLILWSHFSKREKDFTLEFVPIFINLFLLPDIQSYKHGLSCLGLSEENIKIIITESYNDEAVNDAFFKSANPTIKLFRRLGVHDLNLIIGDTNF